jgi:hypothetical protein
MRDAWLTKYPRAWALLQHPDDALDYAVDRDAAPLQLPWGYGAVGDGCTDDTAALQQAMLAAHAAWVAWRRAARRLHAAEVG